MAGTAATLQRHRDRLDEPQQDRLQTALLEQANRLTVLLDDLLDVERFERGGAGAFYTALDAVELVTASVERSPAASRVRLHAPSPVPVTADAVQIDRIVTNLLDNAEKYAPDGPVDVSVTVDAPSVERERHWTIEVADQGPGVPAGEHDRMFDAFHRVAADHPQPGTGVGLALVAQFAQLHGGEVSAANDDGLRVTVRLPVTPVPPGV